MATPLGVAIFVSRHAGSHRAQEMFFGGVLFERRQHFCQRGGLSANVPVWRMAARGHCIRRKARKKPQKSDRPCTMKFGKGDRFWERGAFASGSLGCPRDCFGGCTTA